RLLRHVRHQCDKCDDPAERIRTCVRAVFKQAADPDVAATTRAVLRHTSRGAKPSSGTVEVRQQIADLLTGALSACGSTDPARDALVASCAVFAVMEQFLWTERAPSDDDVEHMVSWIAPPA